VIVWSGHIVGRPTPLNIHWATLTFDLAFRWAKVWSKYRLKSKSKVISLSESLKPKFGLTTYLDRS